MQQLTRDMLPEHQAKQIKKALVNAWTALNIICGKTMNLTPMYYFDPGNDDFRSSLDMKIEHLMENFNTIKNCSRPMRNGIPIKNSISFYVDEYPEIAINHIRKFRVVFAHFYEKVRYSDIWNFIHNDLWNFYNFVVLESRLIFDEDEAKDDEIIAEMFDANMLPDNESVFSVGNVSKFASIGDYSEKEIDAQRRIIEKWMLEHSSQKPGE